MTPPQESLGSEARTPSGCVTGDRCRALLLPAVVACLGGLSGAWVLAAHFGLPAWHGFPNTASTTLLFLASAVIVGAGAPARYKWAIVAGLAFSAVGDAFLMQKRDWFVHGLASFLTAHVCYLWALTSDTGLAARRAPFAVAAVLAVVMLAWLWEGVPGPLRAPVVIYALTLLAMAAQAVARALSRRDPGAILAASGAVLFVVSDTALAYQRFRDPLAWGRFIVLGTYFAAQAGIALSVWRYSSAGRGASREP